MLLFQSRCSSSILGDPQDLLIFLIPSFGFACFAMSLLSTFVIGVSLGTCLFPIFNQTPTCFTNVCIEGWFCLWCFVAKCI